MKTARVIFLDIDGVLNDEDWNAWARKQPWDALKEEFPNYSCRVMENMQFLDPSKVIRFSKLVERADASIVLSTSWTWDEPLPHIADVLFDRGLVSPERIIGALTTNGMRADTWHRTSRAEAILMWLRYMPVERWVAFDDENMEGLLGKDHFIWTDMYNGGLTDEHVSRALKLLGVEDDDKP